MDSTMRLDRVTVRAQAKELEALVKAAQAVRLTARFEAPPGLEAPTTATLENARDMQLVPGLARLLLLHAHLQDLTLEEAVQELHRALVETAVEYQAVPRRN